MTTGTAPAEGAVKEPEAAGEGTGAASAGKGETGIATEPVGKTFTQEELNAIVARERSKVEAASAPLAEKAAELDRIKAAQQTDQEKAEQRAAEAEATAKRVIAEANRRLLAADLRLQAAAQGARPEAIDLVVDRLLGSDDLDVTEKGEVKGTEAAVKALLGKHEYLKASDKDPLPKKSGGEFKGTEPVTIDDQIAAAEAKGDYKTARSLKLRKYEAGKQ